MRIFMSDRMRNMMQSLGMKDGESIEHRMVTNAVEKAQRKVEGRNFDIRKQLLEYDDVANDQRRVVYGQRNDLMEMGDISAVIENVRIDVVNEVIDEFIPPQSLAEQWDIEGLERQIATQFSLELPVQQWLDDDTKLYEEVLRERILGEITKAYEEKEAVIGAETMRKVERQMMLQVLDNLWKEHLATMDHLRQGIHLRGYGQKNPKQEYKREAFGLFEELLRNIKHDTIRVLSNIRIRQDEEIRQEEERRRQEAEAQLARAQFKHDEASPLLSEGDEPADAPEGANGAEDNQKPFVRDEQKVGRNDPCPCGSGKKFKHCHGKLS